MKVGRRPTAKLGWHNNEFSDMGLPLGVLFFMKKQVIRSHSGGEMRISFLVQYLHGTTIDALMARQGWFSYGYEETNKFFYEGPLL